MALIHSWGSRFLSALIVFYQRWISIFLPPSCRFAPSCSEYSRQAFKKYSIPKAFLLTIKRLLRCHPYCEGGFDPVP